MTFQGRDDAPIPIILTTLAAHAYQQERSVVETLRGLIDRMPAFIDYSRGYAYVANPTHYLAACLRSARFQRELEKNMGQTTRNQVPITGQRELKISLPPIALQREFTRRVAAVEAIKRAHRASLAELHALFATLQHRAFRGEL